MKSLNAMERELLENITYFRKYDRAGFFAVLGIIGSLCTEQEAEREDINAALRKDFAGATRGELKRAIRRLRSLRDHPYPEIEDRAVEYIRCEHLGK